MKAISTKLSALIACFFLYSSQLTIADSEDGFLKAQSYSLEASAAFMEAASEGRMALSDDEAKLAHTKLAEFINAGPSYLKSIYPKGNDQCKKAIDQFLQSDNLKNLDLLTKRGAKQLKDYLEAMETSASVYEDFYNTATIDCNDTLNF